MAYNEDVIRRNPFDFKLIDVVSNDSQKRIAMTEEQQKLWMDFVRTDKTYCKYYDEFVVLLGTGMRVSEFCRLTKADLDFAGRKIRVDHQLVRERGGKYYVEKAKTECGCRYIPMTDEVYRSLQKHSLPSQARENGRRSSTGTAVSSAGQERQSGLPCTSRMKCAGQ